ncbi:replication initiation protein [Citreicella sp. C3M06]|uniref:replication initiation protein n=1 Tax=Roseobacteraceae TaxID=2854170 RepID=UPI001C0A5465|nr:MULTISPECIES: replication initiation protein [Roseobacteraceae]MBU2961049.1 replication initiation protein [Citreicella sp. C3M06]MDO6585284.1 replication initiation protein [Salipiger sp. 1_MG-2023]
MIGSTDEGAMDEAGNPADIPRDRLSGPLRRGAVKKHVAAIHVSGKLTLLQRKLSNVLLLNAYDTITTQTRHQIDARTLCLMIGYNSNDMETLKASLRGLAETVAEWDMLDEEGRQEWGVSALLSYAKLKGGICEYAYSPALAEKLHDPKVFALINLNIQRRFTSGHALALYENCYRFVRTGSTGWWSLDLFRRLMGVSDSPYYETFKHLNAKIIKPAVAEVNKTSNIVVTPELRKMGRAVTDIRFRIAENPQLAILDLDDGEGFRNAPVYARLKALGVSDRLARQWMGQHGETYVRQKLDYVAGQAGVSNPVGYLTKALSEDYGKEVSPRNPAPTPAPVTARARRLARIKELAAARTPTQRDADKRLFMARLEGAAREDFERHAWMSALNAEAIAAFWEELSPGAFDGLDPTN